MKYIKSAKVIVFSRLSGLQIATYEYRHTRDVIPSTRNEVALTNYIGRILLRALIFEVYPVGAPEPGLMVDEEAGEIIAKTARELIMDSDVDIHLFDYEVHDIVYEEG